MAGHGDGAFILPPAVWEPTESPHRSASPSNCQHLVRSAHGKRAGAVGGLRDAQGRLLLVLTAVFLMLEGEKEAETGRNQWNQTFFVGHFFPLFNQFDFL